MIRKSRKDVHALGIEQHVASDDLFPVAHGVELFREPRSESGPPQISTTRHPSVRPASATWRRNYSSFASGVDADISTTDWRNFLPSFPSPWGPQVDLQENDFHINDISLPVAHLLQTT